MNNRRQVELACRRCGVIHAVDIPAGFTPQGWLAGYPACPACYKSWTQGAVPAFAVLTDAAESDVGQEEHLDGGQGLTAAAPAATRAAGVVSAAGASAGRLLLQSQRYFQEDNNLVLERPPIFLCLSHQGCMEGQGQPQPQILNRLIALCLAHGRSIGNLKGVFEVRYRPLTGSAHIIRLITDSLRTYG